VGGGTGSPPSGRERKSRPLDLQQEARPRREKGAAGGPAEEGEGSSSKVRVSGVYCFTWDARIVPKFNSLMIPSTYGILLSV
jgi:hypothetical protein